ncbi:MAG: putative quinol monooxygenase [Planctomycetota bacterium]|nr:putative quinol monooxygenase [Planctomycetota bacterium]
MFVVCVEFEIVPEFVDRFRSTVLKQASNSLSLEPMCKRFDVSQGADNSSRFFLYELYEDAAAFAFHRTTPYFAQFNSDVTNMIASKALKTYELVPAI